MATKKTNTLAAGLDAVDPSPGGGTGLKVLQLFGDQPDVLESIERARRERHLSYESIAKYFRANGVAVGESAIKNYLNSQGID